MLSFILSLLIYTYTHACEKEAAVYKELILKELELNQAKLKRVSIVQAEESVSTEVKKFGHLSYEETTPESNLKDQWKHEIWSWKKIYIDYLVPAISPDSTQTHWLNLDYYTQHLLKDFENKNQIPEYHFTTRFDEPVLARIILKIHQRDFAFTKKEKQLLLKNPVFATYLKEKNYDQLLKYVSNVYNHYFHFYKEPTVKRLSQSIFEVPMDPGDFNSQGLKTFEGIINKYWSSPLYKIKIKWINNPLNENKYYRLIGFQIRGVTHVNRLDRVINFYDGITEGTIAHEFGHVLGFSDLYFRYYNTQTCSFITTSNRIDIMSDSTYGSVLDKHWEVLDQHYRP